MDVSVLISENIYQYYFTFFVSIYWHISQVTKNIIKLFLFGNTVL